MSAPSSPNAIVLAIKGLVLNPSTFDPQASNGSLTIADNVVIDRPSVVATRRGFANVFASTADNGTVNTPTTVDLINDGALSMMQYSNHMLINTTDQDLHAIKYAPLTNIPYLSRYKVPNPNYPATEPNEFILYPVPDPANPESRVRGLETNKNFYFITQDGTYRLDHVDGQPRFAGAPAGLNGYGSVTASGAGGWFPNHTRVAYRVVFGYKDYNNQLVLGAPSSRIIVSNTSGAAATAVSLTFQIPKEILAAPTDWFFQVYRSAASADYTVITDAQPDDEMALAYEDICSTTITPITAGQITISDITPSTLLGASLYTNQGQDGILQSNYRPPWALDITTFKQYAFYANTYTLMNANLTLISAGASNGANALIPGNTITFTSTEFGGSIFTLTAVSGGNDIALGRFQVSNTGNPAYDIQVTANNLAYVANAYAANTMVAAYYISGANDLPGQLNFSRLTLTTNTFVITSNNDLCWEQPIPLTSTNDSRPNRIYYSKFNQPEAVPIVNYFEVGSANAPIRRIVPLRDGVMVMKDDGVFRISNYAPPFTITPIDFNVRILAANTAAELDNKVYFLSDQGVVALSDSDAQIMSFVLDRTIIENTSPDLFPNLRQVAWGLAYQSDRKYVLAMPSTGEDTQSTQQYIYNHLTQVWTKWTLGTTCGIVFKKDGKMYLGSIQGSANSSGDSFIYQERKSFTTADYADNQYTTHNNTNAISIGTNVITIVNPVLPPGVILETGWTIQQTSSGSQASIVKIDTTVSGVTTLTLDKLQNWAVGDVTLYTPIYCEVETIQLDCDNPGMNKQFSEMIYIFTEQNFSSIESRISSNTTSVAILDILYPTQRGGWGIDPWSITPWGGGTGGQGKIRRYVPQAVQRAGWLYLNLSHAECFTSFGWSGLELYFKQTSSRQK